MQGILLRVLFGHLVASRGSCNTTCTTMKALGVALESWFAHYASSPFSSSRHVHALIFCRYLSLECADKSVIHCRSAFAFDRLEFHGDWTLMIVNHRQAQ